MIRLYCDFDGTLSPVDVGDSLFRVLDGAASDEIVDAYHRGAINSRECLTRKCAAASPLDPAAFWGLIDGYELDPHAGELIALCARQEIPVTIVSDGLDLYIQRILSRHGLGHVPFVANKGVLVPCDGGCRLEVSFPWTDAECPQCGNCKRNHLLTQSADDDVIVYIGDGMSDRCPVRYADVVFAKGSLIRHCQEENITYHAVRHLGDVCLRLSNLLADRTVRRRREAAMARRDVFLHG